MGVAAVTVAVTRHAAQLDASGPGGVAELQWPPKWEFPLAAALSSLVLAALAVFPAVQSLGASCRRWPVG